jgi:hypothetical protein
VSLFVLLGGPGFGCAGDEEDPMLPGTPSGDYAVPRSWEAGGSLGYAVITLETKDPFSLTDLACYLDAQFATAAAAGALPVSDSEGECIVTDSTSWTPLTGDPVPACAGTVAFLHGDERTRYVVCSDGGFPNPLTLDCAKLTGADAIQITSAPEEIEGDLVGALDLTVGRPGVPQIRTPAPQGMGTALWPAAGDLVVEWTEAGSDAVEIVLGRATEGGPRVRCLTADDGAFAIPSRLTEVYRTGNASLEIRAIEQVQEDVDGFDFRASYVVNDAIELFVP